MNDMQAFDDLAQMDKARAIVERYEQQLETQRAILAAKERLLLEGGEHGPLAAETKQSIEMLQQSMNSMTQKLEKAREIVSQGPQACRAWVQQSEAESDAFYKMLETYDHPPAAPPGPQIVRVRGARAVGPDAPTGGLPAPDVAPAPGGPGIPSGAPVAATEEAVAGEELVGAGTEAAVGVMARLGRVLMGLVLVAAVVGGGYWAYNHFTSNPTSPPPAPVAPQQPGGQAPQQPGGQAPQQPGEGQQPAAPAPPPPFNIDGDYTGTARGATCVKPECYVTVTKVSDPSGPGPDQAGRVTVVWTTTDWKPASTGVASAVNFRMGPMYASLAQDGTVKGDGSTSLTDTSPGGTTTVNVNYTLNGKFTGGTSGSPSYTLSVNANDDVSDLTGTRTG
ncbi:hypothetical protein AB0H73_27800 [Streptomyces olivoreticuli]